MGLHKIIKIVVALLAIAGAAMTAYIWTLDEEALQADLKLNGIQEIEVPSMISNIMLISWIILGIILVAVLIFVIKGLFSGNAKKTLISIGAFLAVIAVSFFTASSEFPADALKDGEVLSDYGAKWVGAGINAFFILAVIAIGLMLFSGVKKLVK